MITEKEIQQINACIEGEILLAFGSNIFSEKPPTITRDEEDGIVYLTEMVDSKNISKKFIQGSSADYLKTMIKGMLDNPLKIFTSEQAKNLSPKEVKIYMQKAIYKFLKEYRDKRVDLENSQKLKDFLPQWLESHENNLSMLEQTFLQDEILVYQQRLQEFPAAIAHDNKFYFYMTFFIALCVLGMLGFSVLGVFESEISRLAIVVFSSISFFATMAGIFGMSWAALSDNFKETLDLRRSLPADMRNSSNSMIIHQLGEKLRNLNSQLEQLQQSQLSTTAQLLQTTPQETVAEKPEETISAPPLQSTPQLRQRSIKNDKSDEEEPSVQKTF